MQGLTCCGHSWNVNCRNDGIQVTKSIVSCLDHLLSVILSTGKCRNCEEWMRIIIMLLTSSCDLSKIYTSKLWCLGHV